MRKIRQLREEILKKDYLNSDIMKITEVISFFDDLFDRLPKNREMKSEEKSILLKKEAEKIKKLILAYTKKNKTITLEIQQLDKAVDVMLHYIENTIFH